jgi:drug/metabolite transporter (DMT)-like permease
MKDLTPQTLIAVFEEIFGRGLFWTLVALAAAVTLAYLYVLIRDRSVSWKKFLLAQISMPFGAVAAVWFILFMTHSHLSDLGGPVDLIVLFCVAAVGAIGMGILVYTLEALVGSDRTRNTHPEPANTDDMHHHAASAN